MTTFLKRRRRVARAWIAAVGGALAIALAVAGCGGGGGGGSNQAGSAYGAAPAASSQKASAAVSGGSGAATVMLAKSSLGKILVNGKGQTLYLWQADTGRSSACSGACASEWPPVTTTGTPIAAGGVSSAKLGTTKRSDGTTEVTYNGHPLYTFVGDSSPGQATGEGNMDFGAEWDVVSPAGNRIDAGGS